MATYHCKLGSPQGKVRNLILEGRDESTLRENLEKQGYFVFSVIPDSNHSSVAGIFSRLLRGKSDKQLIAFCRQMATMLRSGLSLDRALALMSDQSDDVVVRGLYGRMAADVKTGLAFSDIMGKNPDHFPELLVRSVKAGEAAGSLPEVLNNHARFTEAQRKLRSTLTQAFVYPGFLLMVSVCVLAYLLVSVMPKFREIFTSMGASLPWITQFVIGISDFLVDRSPLLLVVLFALIYELREWYATTSGRRKVHGFFLKLPIIGDLILKYSILRIISTMTTLLRGGLSLTDSLRIVVSTVGNQVLYESLQSTIPRVESGVPLSEALSSTGHFPQMVDQIIRVGEESGSMIELLDGLGEHYQIEVSELTELLATAAEPALMLATALVAGTVVISMFLPVIQMSMSVKF
ncbi:MAG: hypothetical protein CVV64_04045 [Candidatus Wallbacteria bacterium HGW-Wallbacteria-1]|jgi:type IV pilus assembly protein PilC|uniref:Type II secretion system protein GspF domain-containing protein n=1 Tax=Candidatus Wallbacteria bacterium HGW-Wallbacteria-1 TaxID=2013854 RepID=A0A2N1PRJ1_9BACT|nr:MAG: hypothetical protein CVV64_04045 [Candidatus Wallbacteria bacterium HGW-Wallbacteria-1]